MSSREPSPPFRMTVVVGSILCVALLAGVVFMILRQTGPSAADRLIANGTTRAGVSGAITTDPTAGGLRLCNQTPNLVNVAVGYKLDGEWTTEGWWNVATDDCETLVKGQLVSRFYYLYAFDAVGGVWGGQAIMCTSTKIFTINGIVDCVARGFERTGFFEVDTGEQRSWTVQLTDPDAAGAGG